jgi:DHA2 family multidrug resistance protein-like MFS transporter
MDVHEFGGANEPQISLGAIAAAVTADVEPRAGRREWIGLAVIALPCLLYSMDLTVLNLAVPQLSADLQPSSAQLLWIIDIYGFVVAGSLMTMGTLGDRIGRRRLLLIGAGAFGVASVLTAFSTSAEMLIATRALLGFAGATLAPSTMSLIRIMFLDSRQRTVAIGVWAASFSAGAAIGPALGGMLLEYFWWGSVFLLGVPVMALLLVLGPLLLPEYRDPDAGRLDLRSAVLSLAAVLALIYALKQIAVDGVRLQPMLAAIAGLAIGAAFLRRQRRLPDPLIDLSLFRVPAFSAALAATMLTIFVAIGAFLFIGQYLQLVLGLSPLRAGLWSLPSAGALIVGSVLAPALVRWMQPAFVVGAGLACAAVGLVVLTQVDVVSGLAVVVTGSIIVSLGVAVVIPLTTEMIVGTAPLEHAGAAAALSETGAELGSALGIAVLGSIGSAVYRSAVLDEVPASVPADAADAARDTLGGALAVAQHLPIDTGSALLDAAREAFTRGLHVSAAVAALVAAVISVVAVALLRHPQPGAEPEAGLRPDEDLEPAAA